MNPDELKARLMAAWHKGIIAEEEASFVESLIDIVDEQQAALEAIEYNLEGYPDNRCQACSYNLQTIRPEAKEALTATRERLKAWVGE